MQFPAQQVERHAHSVALVADMLADARATVPDVTMETGSYGVLCQFLPALLSPAFEAGVGALTGAADALHETAARLRDTARSMRGADAASRDRIVEAGRAPAAPPR